MSNVGSAAALAMSGAVFAVGLTGHPSPVQAETRDAVAAGDVETPRPGVWELLVRDVAAMGDGVVGPTPVGEYHARHNRDRRARHEREQRVFRDTQSGPFDVAIADAAHAYCLDPFLLKGLLENESRLDPDLVGRRVYQSVGGREHIVSGGARGIAQFTNEGVDAVNEVRERRHRRGERVRPFTRDDTMNPERSIDAAAELLRSYIDRFGRDGGITAYNSGPYGGRLVARHGFHRARAMLERKGRTRLQGYRFLPRVLRRTNRLREEAGLDPLPKIGHRTATPKRRRPVKHHDKVPTS